jgi:hypothetical protein
MHRPPAAAFADARDRHRRRGRIQGVQFAVCTESLS